MGFKNLAHCLLQAHQLLEQITRLWYTHAHRQEMMTGAATATAPTAAPLQMPTKNMRAPTTVTLRTAAYCRHSNLQAMCMHDYTGCVHTDACAVHNTTLLGEDRENFEG